jgi:hypothetical protein
MRHAETLILAIVFAACHFVAPWAFKLRERSRAAVTSFAGGLAASYVFLHLIPEIDKGSHHMVGERIYFFMLVGLASLYGIELFIHRSHSRAAAPGPRLALHATLAAIYSFLLVLTLSEQLPASAAMTVVFAVSMGLHLLSADLGLQEKYPERFVNQGRFGLILAVFAGYAVSLLGQPDEALIDILTALLAGFMMFNIFRNEVPEYRDAHFRGFLLGAGLFLVAHVLLTA